MKEDQERMLHTTALPSQGLGSARALNRNEEMGEGQR